MNVSAHFSRTLLFSSVLLASACAPLGGAGAEREGTEPPHSVAALTRGVYGDPGTLLEAGHRFDELGMNAIFVRSTSLDQALYDSARAQGMAVHVEFPTLLGRGYVEENPEALPIDETGQPSPQADWFMGVCPTDSGFQAHRSQQLRSLLENYEVDGIFLDYVHWHAQFESTDPILPETCFCDRCVSEFSAHSGVAVPGGATSDKAHWILANADPEWREWRSQVLNEWVSDLGGIVNTSQPDAKLGIFHSAWYPDEHDGALYRTLGIDLDALAAKADVMSPMLFHRLKGKPTDWVSEYTQWLGQRIAANPDSDAQIWPIVQAHDAPDAVSAAEFARALRAGSQAPATGVMMFSDRPLLASEEKLEVVRDFFRSVPAPDGASNESP